MPKKTFEAEYLREEVLWTPSVVSDVITGQGRWSTYHEVVFIDGDALWRTSYSVGSTEVQDEEPWEYLAAVECVEVAPVEKIVTVYEEVQ